MHYGPDVPDAVATFGKDAKSIRYILNTHRHKDHYCRDTFSHLQGAAFYPMKPGDAAQLGKYHVRSFAANHGTVRDAVHFLITDGEKTLFYGLDGAWLLYDEVAAIKEARPDLAVLDGTVGEAIGDYRVFDALASANGVPYVEYARILSEELEYSEVNTAAIRAALENEKKGV